MQQAVDDSIRLRCACTITEARQCRFIRSTPTLYYLPVMLLTSLATLQDKVAGFEAGADDYVVKPFDARHLVARIRLLSRIKRMEQNE